MAGGYTERRIDQVSSSEKRRADDVYAGAYWDRAARLASSERLALRLCHWTQCSRHPHAPTRSTLVLTQTVPASGHCPTAAAGPLRASALARRGAGTAPTRQAWLRNRRERDRSRHLRPDGATARAAERVACLLHACNCSVPCELAQPSNAEWFRDRGAARTPAPRRPERRIPQRQSRPEVPSTQAAHTSPRSCAPAHRSPRHGRLPHVTQTD